MVVLIWELDNRLSAVERSTSFEQRALSLRSAQVFVHELQARFGTIEWVEEELQRLQQLNCWPAEFARQGLLATMPVESTAHSLSPYHTKLTNRVPKQGKRIGILPAKPQKTSLPAPKGAILGFGRGSKAQSYQMTP